MQALRKESRTARTCRLMREAKARKRLTSACAPELTECGRAVFSGPLFGGGHVVRLLARQDTSAVLVEVDGRLTCAKTARGARALLARRLSACAPSFQFPVSSHKEP
jgi:hypothetical protein